MIEKLESGDRLLSCIHCLPASLALNHIAFCLTWYYVLHAGKMDYKTEDDDRKLENGLLNF